MNPFPQNEATLEAFVMSTPCGKHGTSGAHDHQADGNGNVQKSPTKQAPSIQKFLPVELEPLAWLAGKWIVHEPGRCRYPTMKSDFMFAEAIEFVFTGQKMLDYKSESWNPETGRDSLLHRELGFLRIKPGTNEVSLVVSHNFGVAEVLDGTYMHNSMTLETSGISRISFAAEPAVTLTHRVFKFDPQTEELEHVMLMATTRTDLTEHLRIKYKRATHPISDGH